MLADVVRGTRRLVQSALSLDRTCVFLYCACRVCTCLSGEVPGFGRVVAYRNQGHGGNRPGGVAQLYWNRGST